MDVAYINPFLIASREVFQKMVKLDLSLEKPYVRRTTESNAIINSVIQLSGSVCGVVVLRFSQPVALAAAAGLSGEFYAGLTDDCLDALGELANMIVGSAKKLLPSDCPLDMSTPKTRIGDNDLGMPARQPVLVVPCDTPKGRFLIDICLRKLQPGETPPQIDSSSSSKAKDSPPTNATAGTGLAQPANAAPVQKAA